MATHFHEIRITPKQLLKKRRCLHPEEELPKLLHYCHQLFRKIAAFYECERYILCWETLNKYGEDLIPLGKEHFHFRFETGYAKKKSATQKWIKENAKFTLAKTGVECHAIMCYPEINEVDWWGYCCKENPILTVSAGWTQIEFEKMTIAAKAIRVRSIAANLAHRAKSQTKKTLYSKIKVYLDQWFKAFTQTQELQFYLLPHQSIFEKILEYYIANNIELNPQSMSSKCYRYMLECKHITPSEYYNICIKHNA